MSIRKSILVGGLLACGAVMAATTAPTTTSPHAGPAWHHHHGEAMLGMSFMHAIHQLNLTPEQQTTIKGYVEASRQEAKQSGATKVDMSVLANPGNPDYTAAIATAKTNAANHIQRMADLETEVYGILTSDQKTKLPQVLADMSAKRAQHHADKQTHHASAPATTG